MSFRNAPGERQRLVVRQQAMPPSATDLMHSVHGELPPGIARVSPGAPLSTLAAMLVEQGVDTFLVVEDEVVVGVLRSRDVVGALIEAPREAPRRDVTAAAAALTLKLRRMQTGEKLHGEFASMEDAESWLRERPFGIEVLGVVQPVLSSEDEHRLHEAMRPKSDDERALERERDEAEQRRRRTQTDELQAEAMRELSVQFSADPSPKE